MLLQDRSFYQREATEYPVFLQFEKDSEAYLLSGYLSIHVLPSDFVSLFPMYTTV